VYHADCGGQTTAAADVWGGAGLPYLRAQPDDGDAQGAHAGWQYAADAEVLRRALDADPRTRVGGRLTAIAILARDRSGRAQRVLLRGATEVAVRGVDLREVLSVAFGPRSIRSTLFDVVPNGRQFVFSGSGFGHGVGLCQAGALARVSAGETPADVLRHYYPGTILMSVRNTGDQEIRRSGVRNIRPMIDKPGKPNMKARTMKSRTPQKKSPDLLIS
jgi:stage II sporulation protein D